MPHENLAQKTFSSVRGLNFSQRSIENTPSKSFHESRHTSLFFVFLKKGPAQALLQVFHGLFQTSNNLEQVVQTQVVNKF